MHTPHPPNPTKCQKDVFKRKKFITGLVFLKNGVFSGDQNSVGITERCKETELEETTFPAGALRGRLERLEPQTQSHGDKARGGVGGWSACFLELLPVDQPRDQLLLPHVVSSGELLSPQIKAESGHHCRTLTRELLSLMKHRDPLPQSREAIPHPPCPDARTTPSSVRGSGTDAAAADRSNAKIGILPTRPSE